MTLVIYMINIGLTGWGDHYSLYEDLERQTDKLKTYAGHFPVVELDATYYAIQPEKKYIEMDKKKRLIHLNLWSKFIKHSHCMQTTNHLQIQGKNYLINLRIC